MLKMLNVKSNKMLNLKYYIIKIKVLQEIGQQVDNIAWCPAGA